MSDRSLRRKTVAARLVQLVPKADWLLDLGGATGGLSPWLSANPRPRVVVLNLDSALLKNAGDSEYPVVGDGCRLPFREGVFHGSTCIDVLEHVPATCRPAVLSEMKRVTTSHVLLYMPNEDVCRPYERVLYHLSLDRNIRRLVLEHLTVGPPDLDEIVSTFPGCEVSEVRNAYLWLLFMVSSQLPGVGRWVAGPVYRLLFGLDGQPPFYSRLVEWSATWTTRNRYCEPVHGQTVKRPRDGEHHHRLGTTAAID